MKLLSADFVTSAAAGGRADGIPRDGIGQIAVAGRSNVGKSSLLNALCRRSIARTSAAPGKTRLANIFKVTLEGGGGTGPGRWSVYLVDLPGYGYARGGSESSRELAAVAAAYFDLRRETLEAVQRAGLIDDRRFAASRAALLARRGAGDLLIAGDLERHGVPADAAQIAIGGLEPESARADSIVDARGRSPRTARYLAAKGFSEASLEALVADLAAEAIG